ncbi:MAG: zinc ribbon domain-containing protein [Chloroflexi bacterium]|nr:zinc ribbon domain-containing protein [Chloroflexota bacterium]
MPLSRPDTQFRRTALATLCLGLLIIGVHLSASAQGPQPAIQQSSLRLWPEYDDPGLLVIFAGTFSNTATFPVQVAFPLPEGARGIQATMQDAAGQLVNQDWEIAGSKLIFTLPQPAFHTEYYLDRPPSGNPRALSYTFVAPYAIRTLEIAIQQPARSTGFTVTPQPESSYQETDGLTYYRINRTNLASGDKVPIVIRYTKSDQGFSANPAQTQASQPTAVPAIPATVASRLPFVLIGLGVAVLAGAAIYWVLQRRQPPAAAGRGARSQVGALVQPAGRSSGKTFYCTQCGRQLKPEDRFCANCGTPRKG